MAEQVPVLVAARHVATEPGPPAGRSGGMDLHATFVLRIFLGLTLLLVVVACGERAVSPDPITPGSLAGTSWQVVSVDGRSAVPGREPTAAFDQGRVGGTGGCNDYGGDYTYDADAATLIVRDVASTLVLCDGPIGTFEGALFLALQGPLRVSVDGAMLTLQGVAHSIVLVDIGDNTGG